MSIDRVNLAGIAHHQWQAAGRITGDKNPCTEPVCANYMLVICPEYQNFPESEYAEFFQNMLNNISTISQPSILWEYSKSTDSLWPQYLPSANAQYF